MMCDRSKAALEIARGVVRGNKEVFLSKPRYVPDEAQRTRLYEAYYIKMAHEFKMLKRNFFEYHLDVDRGSGTNPKRVRERIPNFILWIVCCGCKGSERIQTGSVVEEMYGDGMSQEFMARMEAIWEEKD